MFLGIFINYMYILYDVVLNPNTPSYCRITGDVALELAERESSQYPEITNDLVAIAIAFYTQCGYQDGLEKCGSYVAPNSPRGRILKVLSNHTTPKLDTDGVKALRRFSSMMRYVLTDFICREKERR
jgi:hypothetical protein